MPRPPQRALPLAAIAVAVASVACVVGCQRKKKKEPVRLVRELARPAVPIKMLREVVLDTGSAPLSLRRYRSNPAAKTILEKTVTASIDERRDGEPVPTLTLPPLTTVLELAWSGGDEPGIEVRALPARIEGDGASEEALAMAGHQLTRYRNLLEGRSARVELSARGVLGHAITLGKQEAATPVEFLLALLDVTVVLPEVPIGVGAVWEVTRAVPRGTGAVKHVATYKLVSIDGDTLNLEAEVTVIGERQPLTLSSGGTHGELLALREKTTGTLTIDLDRPVPTRGSIKRNSTIHTRVAESHRTVADYLSTSSITVELSTRPQ